MSGKLDRVNVDTSKENDSVLCKTNINIMDFIEPNKSSKREKRKNVVFLSVLLQGS